MRLGLRLRSSTSLQRSTWLAAALSLPLLVACGSDGNTVTGSTSSSSTTSSSSGGGAGGEGAGGGQSGAPVTILNWNLHNLFDDKKDTDEDVVSTSEYQEHLDDIAKILSEMDPDIGVFAEVENIDALNDLNEKIGGGYTATLIEGNDTRHTNVGVLSKLAFSDVVSHKDDEFVLAGTPAPTYKYTRDCLEVHVPFASGDLVLLAVHFRSKGNPDATPPVPDDADKRLAEGQHTKEIANALAAEDPTRAILILGDFNDLPGSTVYNWIGGSEPNKYTDAADAIPGDDRFTYVYNGTKELIDHQMMSPVLTPLLDASSVTIRHGSDVDDASDHSPLMATYYVP